jgi:iron(III) transport system permease protein
MLTPFPPVPDLKPHSLAATLRDAGQIVRSRPIWMLGLIGLLVLLLLPVATITVLALRGGDGTFTHLASTVFPRAFADTTVLVLGTIIVSLVTGTGTAWLVTMFRFPGRGLLDRLLVLPLAMPAYILAYAYVELLDYSGPIQSGLRALTGWRSVREYWFPDIRSLGGAIFVLSASLYPYVYLSARASFTQQSVCVLEVARTLGRTSFGAFWSVALPLARPALAAGAALVAMECLNDFGATQYLGVQTLTVSIYSTWLQRGSLSGAAQLSLVLLIVVFALMMAERWARQGQRFHHTTGRYRAIPFQQLSGSQALLAQIACVAPVLFGFVLPVLLLGSRAMSHLELALAGGFWRAAWHSILLAALAAVIAVFVGLVLAFARKRIKSGIVPVTTALAGLGYAIPGTVLALGLMLPLAGLDNWVDARFRGIFGVSTGLMISGSLLIVVLAYVIRFLAVSLGAIDAGIERLSPNLDAAARTLGYSASWAWRKVHIPMLLPTLGSAALLVFVDAMKELPATLLLRPFDFDTLATHVYGLAALEQFDAAAMGALAIVLVGLLPVLLLHRAVSGGRAGRTDKPSPARAAKLNVG